MRGTGRDTTFSTEPGGSTARRVCMLLIEQNYETLTRDALPSRARILRDAMRKMRRAASDASDETRPVSAVQWVRRFHMRGDTVDMQRIGKRAGSRADEAKMTFQKRNVG